MASLPSRRRDAADCRTGGEPAHGHRGGGRGVRAVPSVAGPACRAGPGAHADPCPSRPGGFGGAPCPAGGGIVRPVTALAAGGVHASRRPMASWAHQGPRTRCRRRHAKRQEALEAGRAAVAQHPRTQRLAPHVLAAWQAWATDRGNALQRASSAVEGRNGLLSPLQQQQRGLPKPRAKVWPVLHHCDGDAPDGTTPAARFFRRTFPDLFETVLSQIEAWPQPRRGKRHVALCHCSRWVSRLKWVPGYTRARSPLSTPN